MFVNIDPTSVRKKEFSKPGKYTKWLLREYKKSKANKSKGLIEDWVTSEASFKKDLNMKLFVYSTNWFKSKQKDGYYSGGSFFKFASNEETDILKYSYDDFIKTMNNWTTRYKEETDNAEFETVYSDEKIDILIPLNFTASYELAKNTGWCSQSFMGYSSWNKRAILFRIIPKNKQYEMLKLTWDKQGQKTWYIAPTKYPEIMGIYSPFSKGDDGVELWEFAIQHSWDNSKNEQAKINAEQVRKTMSIVSAEAKKCVENYYKKYEEDKKI